MAKLTDKQTWSRAHLLKSWYGFVYLVAFLLEVIALFSIMFISNIITKVGLSQWILSFLIAVALIWFWGQYMAPKGKRRLTGVAFYIAKVVIYLIAAYSINYFQGIWWMIAFLTAFIIDEAFLFLIRNEDPAVFFKTK